MSKLVTLNGKQWLVGLTWDGYDKPLSRRDLAELVLSEDMLGQPDAAYWYSLGSRYVVGLADVPEGRSKRPGLFAAGAAPLMPQLALRVPTVPCAYLLEYAPDLYGVCVIDSNRLVSTGSDRLAGSPEELSDAFGLHMGLGTGATTGSLTLAQMEALLAAPPVLAPPRVHRVSLRSKAAPIAAGVGFALLLSAAGAGWLHFSHAHQQAERLRQAAHRGLALAHQLAVPAGPPYVAPSRFLAACAQAISDAPSAVADRAAATVSCLPGPGAKPGGLTVQAVVRYADASGSPQATLQTQPGAAARQPQAVYTRAEPLLAGSPGALDAAADAQLEQLLQSTDGPLRRDSVEAQSPASLVLHSASPPWLIAGLGPLLDAAGYSVTALTGSPLDVATASAWTLRLTRLPAEPPAPTFPANEDQHAIQDKLRR